MMSVVSTATKLIEPWRISTCSMEGGYKQQRRNSSASTSSSTESKTRRSQRRPARLSLSAQKLPAEESPVQRMNYEEGIFEGIPFSEPGEGDRQGDSGADMDISESPQRISEGLIPDAWKFIQQDIRMTKREKKAQARMQERENAQLKELRAELRRQRSDLLSENEESSYTLSLAGSSQLLTPSQLEKLERDLSIKTPDPRFPDKEFDEVFTVVEKGLLKRIAPDISQVYCKKWPILHMLASSGQFFFLDRFLKSGVEVEEEDEEGYTPLQRAVIAKRETAVTQLVRAGAKLDVCDKDGANLLHLSVQVNSLTMVKLFVKWGVSVNQPDVYGWTPLHLAALAGRANIVRHLVLSGGDQSLQNKEGNTPMDIAFALGRGLNSNAVARSLRRLNDLDLA